jgi:hypothetical protein
MSDFVYACTPYRGTFADFTQDKLTVVSVARALQSGRHHAGGIMGLMGAFARLVQSREL